MPIVAAPVAALITGPAQAADRALTVTTLQDESLTNGRVSLREAMLYAATQSNPTITFAIDPKEHASGPWTIVLTSPLPTISRPLTINGPGATTGKITRNYSDQLSILRAESASLTISGLTIQGPGITDLSRVTGSGVTGSAGTELTLTHCSVRGFVGTAGGGISIVDGSLRVSNSDISQNASWRGGGIFSFNSYVQVLNATLANNKTINIGVDSNQGGGLWFGPANTTKQYSFRFSTVAGNFSGIGGGIYGFGPKNVVDSSIVAGNKAPSDADIYGLPYKYYSLVGGNSGLSFNADGTVKLALNGGKTLTAALLSSSPALNAADPVINGGFDQRGTNFPRAVGGIGDMGGFEYQTPKVTITPIADVMAQASMFSDSKTVEFLVGGSPSTIKATSSNQSLITDSSLTVSGSETKKQLTLSWPSSKSGIATITITATGTNGTATRSFKLMVKEEVKFLINTSKDIVNPYDGVRSLREGIEAINSGELPDGFLLFAIPLDQRVGGNSVIDVASPLPPIKAKLTLSRMDRPSDSKLILRRTGTTNFRFFTIEGNVTVELKFITFQGGVAPTAQNTGGAVLNSGGFLKIIACQFFNNSAENGGAVYNSSGTVEIVSSSFGGNTAKRGGAVFAQSGNLDCNMSTLVNNTATGEGGAIYLGTGAGQLAVGNSTVAGNSAVTGGAFHRAGGAGTVENSIVALNKASSGVGANQAAGITFVGKNIVNQEPGLVVGSDLRPLLRYNGGTVDTVALTPTSPAIDAGAWAKVGTVLPTQPDTDQRGFSSDNKPFARVRGLSIDIGPFEYPVDIPSLDAIPDQTILHDTSLTYTLTAASEAGSGLKFEISSLNPGLIQSKSVTPAGTANQWVLNIIPTPGAMGETTVTVKAYTTTGSVSRTFRLQVVESPSTVVTLTDDTVRSWDGKTSLHEAINYINQSSETKPITFNLPETAKVGGRWVVGVYSALPAVQKSLQISGPGANVLSIRYTGVTAHRILTAEAPITLKISGVSLENGNATAETNPVGGAIYVNGGALILDKVVVTGNKAANGGGVACINAPLTLTNSAVYGNTASSNGGGILARNRKVILSNSTVVNNTAGAQGGGLFTSKVSGDFTCTVESATFAGNTAADGGGIAFSGLVPNLKNTIISGNSATTSPNIPSGFIDSGFNLRGGNAGLELNDKGRPAVKYNGGTTPTVALLAGSAAINAGQTTAPLGLPYDQRGVGFPRISGGRLDIGAFEVQGASASGVSASVRRSGNSF